MPTSRIPLAFLLCGLLAASCRESRKPPAYYFWKTDASVGAEDRRYLPDSSTAYVRLFDVAAENGRAVPIAPAEASAKPGVQVIPVVYITQEALRVISPRDAARQIHALVLAREKLIADREVREWQFDCDWTPRTESRYFALLDRLKELEPGRILSATIRLHQLSPKIGRPPVDRGILMLYGFENPADYKETNSIFDPERAKPYLRNLKDYPIPLDLALPVFSWGVVFYQGRFRHLIREKADEIPQKLTRLDSPFSKAQWFRADSNIWIGPDRIPAGSEIRLEATGPESARAARSLVDITKPPFAKDARIVLFDFHSALSYPVSEIEAAF